MLAVESADAGSVYQTSGGGGTPGGRPPANYPASYPPVIGGHSAPVPPSSAPSDGTPTETVAQAYLAGLAAMGKNTSGDTAPYVVMSPGAGTGAGKSLGLGTVLLLAAIGAGAWWFLRQRRDA